MVRHRRLWAPFGIARFRAWLVRSRFGPVVVSAVLAALTGLIIAAQVGDLRRARAQWGETIPVWVARRGAAVGQPIDAEQRRYPRAVVPQRAVADAPDGLVAVATLDAGQIITSSAVAVDGPAALLPPGWVAVPVPDPARLGAAIFDVGDTLVVFVGGRRTAEALVVGRSGEVLLLGVPADAAGTVGVGLGASAVTLALSASLPPPRSG